MGFTPSEVILKEMKEESGFGVTAERLPSVFDKRKHPHPPQPFYVYKMLALCEAASSEIKSDFDVLAVEYFSVDNLPLLSEDRMLRSQIGIVYQRLVRGEMECYFD